MKGLRLVGRSNTCSLSSQEFYTVDFETMKAPWKKNVTKLKAYRKAYGNFQVPPNWTKDIPFARWVKNLRERPGDLSDHEVNELENIGFSFPMASDWRKMFSKLESFYKKQGHTYVPSDEPELEVLFDWTIHQKQRRSLLTPSQVKQLNSLDFDWGASTDKDVHWQRMYRELVEFKRTHGHPKVPQDYKDNAALAYWVSRQRRYETAGKLTKERIKLLNAIGFLWKRDIVAMRENAWEKRYKELVQYKKTYGHMDRIKIKKVHYQLGLWVETQLVRQGEMPPDRKAKLNAIGFNWIKEDFYEERWNEMYTKLKAHVARHGHSRVTQSQDFKLSVWLQRQKRDKDKLEADKLKKLERLGIKWPYELFKEAWEARYEELSKFKSKNGHLRVGRSHPELFEWMQTQKKLKSEQKLTRQRESQLNKLGFLWKGETDKQKMEAWEKMYHKFKAFQQQHGASYILLLKDHLALNEWVNLQLHSKEKLSAFKRKKLDALNFPWDKLNTRKDALWDERYQQLVRFKKEHGHCDVPQKYSPNSALAQWVNAQRARKLSPDKKARLDKIGFSWSGDIAKKRWQQRVDEYVALKRKGKLHTLQAHTPLYSWIYQQQKNFNALPSEKRKTLLQIGFTLAK